MIVAGNHLGQHIYSTCTSASPNITTKKEIGFEQSSYSCKLGSAATAERGTERDMQMKSTTNMQEGDATILGIWNRSQLSGNTRKKEKGKNIKEKRDNLRYMTY